MPKFRKKPVVIEAVQFTGKNDDEIADFVGDKGYDPIVARPTWIIHTLEGDMQANPGDWIIKGVQGEFYPCKPDIFEQTYDRVEMDDEEWTTESGFYGRDILS
jgi:hypothetical protein